MMKKKMSCMYIQFCFICLAALEVLEKDLATLRQKSELQEANLLVFREQKLNEVQKATYVSATSLVYVICIVLYTEHGLVSCAAVNLLLTRKAQPPLLCTAELGEDFRLRLVLYVHSKHKALPPVTSLTTCII